MERHSKSLCAITRCEMCAICFIKIDKRKKACDCKTIEILWLKFISPTHPNFFFAYANLFSFIFCSFSFSYTSLSVSHLFSTQWRHTIFSLIDQSALVSQMTITRMDSDQRAGWVINHSLFQILSKIPVFGILPNFRLFSN